MSCSLNRECRFCKAEFKARSTEKHCCMECKIKDSVDVNEVTGCWNWNKSIRRGYGRIGISGKWYYAHRKSYEIFHKTDCSKNYICHKCDNQLCVNPDHLYLGNAATNMMDALKRNRVKLKFSLEDMEEIKKLFPILSDRKIARVYKVHPSTIGDIRNGKTYKFYNEEELT